MNVKDIICVRESMTAKQAFPETHHFNEDAVWDYCTIYDEGGNILIRSQGFAKNVKVSLEFNNLMFIFDPGYTEDKVYITLNSLKTFINK